MRGNTTVTAATDTGYVGSGTDGGHGGIANDVLCANSFNPDGTFSKEYINDFFREGVVQQVLFSKAVANSYYGMKPAYNYWNGCSTGGRQGYQLAQIGQRTRRHLGQRTGNKLAAVCDGADLG